MSWRTVIIERRCKLDYRMGYMVIRSDEMKRIYLDEVAILVIENPAVSFTGCLMEAFTEKKIKVVFCDKKHNPIAEVVSLYGSHDSSLKIKQQACWKDETKALVWQSIIKEKIKKQAELLLELGRTREHDLLRSYIPQVEPRDQTNREGHAAKVYFNALFGMDFTRGADNNINAALNYGYSVLLSAVNREIVADGYVTQLGVFHDNRFNKFNLSSDLMEPFRIMVDRAVIELDHDKFDNRDKHSLWSLLNAEVFISGSKQTLMNALTIYLRSVFNALNNDAPFDIRFYDLK